MYESVRLEADPVLAVVSTMLFTLVLIGTVIPAVTRRKRANAT
jgi:ABC-type spermidine/putrescine transport system permease subunit II